MSNTVEGIRRKINGAQELRSVVRTMKALAAASAGQYEAAVRSLADYHRTVELGLAACFRQVALEPDAEEDVGTTNVIVFGSDQGLVGRFNESLAEHVSRSLGDLPGGKAVWAVGDRIQSRLADAGLRPVATFAVPNSVTAITPLIGQILVEIGTWRAPEKPPQIHLFHNRPRSGAAYEPASQRLLPLDANWRRGMGNVRWPTTSLPEILDRVESTLPALVREYLFVSLFKACAESLASENASRLAAMQRAERNINTLLEDCGLAFHQLRQRSIDEELFDVVSGFEALTDHTAKAGSRSHLPARG